MALSMTIGGAAKTVQAGSLTIAAAINTPALLTGVVVSMDGSYRPEIDEEVIVTLDGDDIYGGSIDQPDEAGHQSSDTDAIATTISAADFSAAVDEIVVTETIAAGTTLKAAIQQLDDDLVALGYALSGSQATGPTLTEEIVFQDATLREAFDRLSAMTGWLWDTDPSKTYEFYEPGTRSAPFDIADGDGHVIGDLRVAPDATRYANRLVGKFGPTAVVEKTDLFTGNGSQTTFPLTYHMAAGTIPSGTVGDTNRWDHRGVVIVNGASQTLGIGASPVWRYDATVGSYGSIIRTSAVPNGHSISVKYGAQFPFTVVVDNTTAQAARGGVVRARRVEDEKIFSRAEGELLLEGLLARYSFIPNVATYATRRKGLKPGQTQTIVSTKRNVNADFLIIDVQTYLLGHRILEYLVTAVEGDVFPGNHRDNFQSGAGGIGGGVATASLQFPSSRPVGWEGDDNGNWLPQTDDVSVIGSDLLRILALTLASGSGGGRGVRFKGSGAGFAHLWHSYHATLPSLNISVFNDSSVGGQIVTIYKEGIDAIFRNVAGVQLLDTSEDHKLAVECGENLSADRTLTIQPGNGDRTLQLSWTDVAFSAGNFTGNGSMTWTVASGDQATFQYLLHGKMLTVNWVLNTTTVGGTPNTDLQIAIPGGFTSAKALTVPCYGDNNGTIVQAQASVTAAGTLIAIQRISAGAVTNWSAATDLTATRGSMTFEVQ